MRKKELAVVLIKKILEQKSRTGEEFREEAKKLGIKRSTFFTQRKNLVVRGEIQSYWDFKTGENIWTIIGTDNKANLNKIGLCIDEIKSKNKRLRNLGADEFVHVCQTMIVTHDPRVRVFFKKAFNDSSLRDVHEKLLLAFKCILARTLSDGNNEMVTLLLNENKMAIKKFASTTAINWEVKGSYVDSIRLKKNALYILSLALDNEVLAILYDLIEKSKADEYSMLKAEILDIFRSYPSQFHDDIKRGVFKIAMKEDTKKNEEVIDRAITLLVDLAESRKIIYA